MYGCRLTIKNMLYKRIFLFFDSGFSFFIEYVKMKILGVVRFCDILNSAATLLLIYKQKEKKKEKYFIKMIDMCKTNRLTVRHKRIIIIKKRS